MEEVMKSTRFLMQEHKLILRALDLLDAMTVAAGKDGRVDETDLGKVLDFLRWFGDAHHQAKEETILFSALKDAATAQDRPVRHMILEHEQDRALIEQIETAARLARMPEFVSRANKLSSTLRNHIYKEDQLLFEEAIRALDDETDDKVLARLAKFETEFDKELLDVTLRNLRALEWKYLRRTA
jgi:hemerythrin-like domain-containing protein